MLLSDVLSKAKADGLVMRCYYDDPTDADYVGTSTRKAKEALLACDVMNLDVCDMGGKRLAWLFIVNEFDGDPEEQVADCTVSDWVRKHWPDEVEGL